MKRADIKKENIHELISTAVSYLRSGKIIIIPTDTVYGLACDAKNKDAINRIFALKTRSNEKSLPVFISSFEMLDDVALIKNNLVQNFLKKFWPGALTAVLPARGWMPLEVRGGGLTIGVRMPNHRLTLDIIEEFGGPITGTSANLSGMPASGKIDEIISQFKHMPLKPDLILDAGDLPESEPSTVVDCSLWPPRVLRAGAVELSDI